MFKFTAFSLIKLIIIISLLGTVVLGFILALDPVEKANRDRDKKFRDHSLKLTDIISEYFDIEGKYPWVSLSPQNYKNESSFGFLGAEDFLAGFCTKDSSECNVESLLLGHPKIKTPISNDFINTHLAASVDKTNRLLVGKREGETIISACFVPLSKVEREKACNEEKAFILGNNGQKQSLPMLAEDCRPRSPKWLTPPFIYACVTK